MGEVPRSASRTWGWARVDGPCTRRRSFRAIKMPAGPITVLPACSSSRAIDIARGGAPRQAVRHRVCAVVAAKPVVARAVKEALANPSEDRREKKWRGEEGCLTAPEEGVAASSAASAFKGIEAERWKQGNFQIADTNNKARLVFASRMCIASPRERRKFGGELSSWANKSPFAPFSVPLALGRAPENLRPLPVS